MHHLTPCKSSQQHENEMFRQLVDSSRTAMLDDATTSLTSSGSYVDHLPSMLYMNDHNPNMSGYPSVEGGEPICDLLAGAHISGHTHINSQTHQSQGLSDVTLTGYRVDVGALSNEQLEYDEGTLVPATMLESLLASRSYVYENVDDPTLCHVSNSRAFSYEDDTRMCYDRSSYNNQIQSDMSDVWLQPHAFFYGGGSYGAAVFNNELSLSLATLHSNSVSQPMSIDHRAEMSCSGLTINHDLGTASETMNQRVSTSSGSNYLLAVQELLADLSRVCLENVDLGSSEECSENGVAALSLQKHEVDAKKQQLKVLLKMADDGYNQCLKEVHKVMSKFHSITGLDSEEQVQFVLQTTSFLYKSLKERISAQMQNMKTHLRNDSITEQEGSFDSSFIHKQWALQQMRRKEHQLWRPQRGLPERSVSVLRAWMFQNFLRPYPKDSEKHMLAIKSGLTRSQVSNWFINARVRLWKPMIEEMYAEINRRKTHWKGHVTDSSTRGDSSMGIERFQRD